MEDREKDLSPEEPGGAAGAEPAPESEVGGPDEVAELKSRMAYLAAEFDNFRKRVAREREVQAAFGNEQLLRAVLPFLDNLERALGQREADAPTLLAGVRMTYDQFLGELRKFGLEQLSAEGQTFDPARHEAIATVPWKGLPEGTVLAEARKGYLLNGRLLRPAQVTVVKAAPDDGPAEPSPGAEN
jgi:molecular chaperone GrpE